MNKAMNVEHVVITKDNVTLARETYLRAPGRVDAAATS